MKVLSLVIILGLATMAISYGSMNDNPDSYSSHHWSGSPSGMNNEEPDNSNYTPDNYNSQGDDNSVDCNSSGDDNSGDNNSQPDATSTPVVSSTPVSTPVAAPVSTAAATSSTNSDFVTQSLTAHNAEREILGIADLTWSATLAASAAQWAQSVAQSGSLQHSSASQQNIGENLALSVSTPTSVYIMLQSWAAEKSKYVHKPYPGCSSSGNANDVAYYTQMIWQATTQVGCGVATGNGKDYLVCQYQVGGNVANQYVYDKNTVNIPTGASAVLTAAPAVTSTPAAATPVVQTPAVQSPPATSSGSSSGGSTIQEILDAHNAERSQLGLPNLVWAPELVGTATSWAQHLASVGSLSHSPGRVHIGENVAYTGSKTNSLARNMQMWMDEKQYFKYGKYPNLSTTGDSGDVGHYTQVIWKNTVSVGCASATGHSRDFLVCQYKPAGNMRGEAPY